MILGVVGRAEGHGMPESWLNGRTERTGMLQVAEQIKNAAAQAGGYRALARATGGDASFSTLNAVARRRHRGRFTDKTVRGIARALGWPVSTVATMLGHTMDVDLPPFVLPARANRLPEGKRRLVVALVDSMLGEDGDATLAEIDRLLAAKRISVGEARQLMERRLEQLEAGPEG